jgi:hypothetical protein
LKKSKTKNQTKKRRVIVRAKINQIIGQIETN